MSRSTKAGLFFAVLLAAALIQASAGRGTPRDVLYDQYDNASVYNMLNSQNFEHPFDRYDSEAADDFRVPAGLPWSVSGIDVRGRYFGGPGPAYSFNVRFYRNTSDKLPGTLVAERRKQTFTHTAADFAVTISPAVRLEGGAYWVSVQANQNLMPDGHWGWTMREVQSRTGAALRFSGGPWTRETTWPSPDLVFLIRGTAP